MKKTVLLFTTLIALLAALPGSAQERGFRRPRRDSLRRIEFILPDSLRSLQFRLPDSLALSPWQYDDVRYMEPIRMKPAVSMTSVVVIQRENLPARVTVLDNNSLRLGRHFDISNGSAWNWGPYRNSFLDARTLSFPAPR